MNKTKPKTNNPITNLLKIVNKNTQINEIYGDIKKIKQELEVNPNSIVLLSQLAEKYNLTSQYRRAIESCDKILKDGKKYKPAYNNMFYAYDLLEDPFRQNIRLY